MDCAYTGIQGTMRGTSGTTPKYLKESGFVQGSVQFHVTSLMSFTNEQSVYICMVHVVCDMYDVMCMVCVQNMYGIYRM